jgi:hypothetical protein
LRKGVQNTKRYHSHEKVDLKQAFEHWYKSIFCGILLLRFVQTPKAAPHALLS